MDRVLEYISMHPGLAALFGGALVAVIVVEIIARRADFAAVTPQDAIRLMNGGALVLDLRNGEQFAAGHINGARRLDSHEILKAGETFRKHKEKPVLVYCDSGSLAGAAARTLAAQGFTKAVNLRGGLNGWRAENLPLTKGSAR